MSECTRCHGAGCVVTHDYDSDTWLTITCPRCWGQPMPQPVQSDMPVTMPAEVVIEHDWQDNPTNYHDDER